MMSYWSDEVRIMLHPLITYRQLARRADNSEFRLLLRRPLLVVLVLSAFVSFTASGHLTLPLLLEGAIFWGFVPILQTLLMVGIVLAFARGQMPMPKTIDLFFMGYGPCLLWMLVIVGSCLFFPLRQIYLWPTKWGWILPVSLIGAWLWSNVISVAFLRGALNLTALRAALALLLYTVIFWGGILSYLFAVETLQLHRLGF
jgi:hypothetical protein